MRIFSIRSSLVRPFPFFHAVFVATDTTQENGLSVQQNVSAVHANFTKADPIADGIGSTGYFYIIQLRFSGVQSSGLHQNNFSGSVFQLDFPAHAKLLDDELCLGCDFSDSVTFAITCPNVPSGTSAILKVLIWHFGTRISAISRYTPQ